MGSPQSTMMNGTTEPVEAETVVPYDREAIFNTLSEFDESADEEFQAGLQAIIGPMQASGIEEAHILETRRRAKVFFWSQRTGLPVDYQEYKAWQTSTLQQATPAVASAAASSTTAAEPYPATFDAIVELITTGKTDQIPGIKDIPLKINEETPTEPKLARPSKPWERAASDIASTNGIESHSDPHPTTE